VILVEYEAEAFEMLRKAYSHDSRDIYEYLINRSVSDQTNHDLLQSNLIMNTSNGSMIFITSDQKYVIKVISKHDKSVFVEVLLEKYINRLIFNPESKLVRILGLFQIKPSRIYFLIMENTCILNDTCLRFDLKGSKVDRLVSESSSNKTILKDQNFLKSKIKVSLPINEYKNMIKTLTEDFKLLKTLGIMDYSIYLVYYTDSIQTLYPHYTVNNISIAVIDLFQLYDSQKALERWWKIYVRCHQRHNLSSVSSQEYFLRIQEFLTQIFEVSKIN
jgi:L-rhamnose mutarotase